MEESRKKSLEHDEDALDDVGVGVVRIHNESGIDRMTEAQKKRVGRFYEVLANAMPLEGRDYRIDFMPSSDGVSVKAAIEGLNDMGRAFARHFSAAWAAEGGRDYNIAR